MTISAPIQGKFVTGSTLKHVLNMTAAGSIGLIAVFAVDLLNLFYISLLGQKELAAAVGYAGTLLFFVVSLSIGLAIAVGAVTSRALGEGHREKAKRLAGASLVLMSASMALASLLLYPFLGSLLKALGATGVTAEMALRFCGWVLPSMPLLGAGYVRHTQCRFCSGGVRPFVYFWIWLGPGRRSTGHRHGARGDGVRRAVWPGTNPQTARTA